MVSGPGVRSQGSPVGDAEGSTEIRDVLTDLLKCCFDFGSRVEATRIGDVHFSSGLVVSPTFDGGLQSLKSRSDSRAGRDRRARECSKHQCAGSCTREGSKGIRLCFGLSLCNLEPYRPVIDVRSGPRPDSGIPRRIRDIRHIPQSRSQGVASCDVGCDEPCGTRRGGSFDRGLQFLESCPNRSVRGNGTAGEGSQVGGTVRSTCQSAKIRSILSDLLKCGFDFGSRVEAACIGDVHLRRNLVVSPTFNRGL